MARGPWTLSEADAALPRVRALLGEARRLRGDVLAAQANLEDLLIVHGPGVRSGGEGHDEWSQHHAARQAAHEALHEALQTAQADGIHVKDLDGGLVDFQAVMGTEAVFLCWREGEDRIRSWHPLEGGFAGRRPVPEAPGA